VSSVGDSAGVAPSGGVLDTLPAIHERDRFSQEERRTSHFFLELSELGAVVLAA
jgi:hypothetical protein